MRECNDLHPGHEFQIFPIFYKMYDTLARVYLICKNCGYTIEKVGIDWHVSCDTEKRDEEAKKILQTEVNKSKERKE